MFRSPRLSSMAETVPAAIGISIHDDSRKTVAANAHLRIVSSSTAAPSGSKIVQSAAGER